MIWLLLILQSVEKPKPERYLELDEVAQDRLVATDPMASTRALEERYPPIRLRSKRFGFLAPESGRYHIDLKSRSFDAYLVVRDTRGNLIAEDDDGWNPSLTQSRVVADLAAGEDYTLDACGGLGGVGDFEIVVRRGEPEPPSAEDLGAWKDDPRARACALRYRGLVYSDLGRPDEARQLFEEALWIAEARLGDESQETAACLYTLGRFLARRSDFAQARSLLERAIPLFEKLLGSDDFQTCDGYAELGSILDQQGDYARSNDLFEKALAGFIQHASEKSSRIGYEALRRGSEVALRRGDWAESEKLLRRCVALAERVYGRESDRAVGELSRLGTCLLLQGDRSAARDCYQRALSFREGVRDEARSSLFEIRTRLASVLAAEGNYEDAQDLLEMNQKEIESSGEAGSLDHAQSAAALGELYRARGKYDKARSACESALSAFERMLGPDNRFVVGAYRDLARVEMESLRLDSARRKLETAERGNDRDPRKSYAVPMKVQILGDWGRLLFLEGRFEEARRAFESSIELSRKLAGAGSPSEAASYLDLVLLLLESGDLGEALGFARKAHAASERSLYEMLRSLSEPERYDYIVTQRLVLETALHLAQASKELDALAFAFDVLSSWKGRIFAGMMSARQRVFRTEDRETLAALKKLRTVQSQISTLFASLEPRDVPVAAQKMGELQRLRGELEKEVSGRTIASKTEPVGWKRLQQLLPPESSFISFVEHRPYRPALREEGRVVEKASWGQPQLSAWIVSKESEEPVAVVLGSSEEIEELLTRFLSKLVAYRPTPSAGPTARLSQLNRDVFAKVWAPLSARIRGDRVFLSSDGCVGRLPLGTIQQASGRYLLEDYRFSYLQEAAGLAHFQGPRSGHGDDLLVVGGVDFEDSAPSEKTVSGELPALERGLRASYRKPWGDLPGTLEEADLIARYHSESFPAGSRLLLHGGGPTEERLKGSLPKYSFVHLASHGFFNPGGLRSFWEEVEIESLVPWMNGTERKRHFEGYMPGLLSGIVCAGANLPPQENRENGLLTAEEVSWLDLSHCDLVVLSACETGLGTVRGGEGIVGLRSAFRQAGAKTVISSLWSVGDRATKDLMERFYKALWAGRRGKLDALRQAQLEVLAEQRKIHDGQAFPYAWGAFVLDGDWR